MTTTNGRHDPVTCSLGGCPSCDVTIREATARDDLAERDRSYGVRLQARHGGRLRARRDIERYGEVVIDARELVEIAEGGFSNAGFRGIEVSVRSFVTGEVHHGISAGAFDVVSGS